MSTLVNDLLTQLNTLLASGTQIPAVKLRAFETQIIGAIGTLEARARGNQIHSTIGKPSDALGMDGDLGVDISTGDFYYFAKGQFNFFLNGAGKVGAFTPIAQNAFGTHPAFTDQDTLNDWLLANRGTGGTVTPTPAKPTITGFLPMSGAQGSTVVLTGTNFTGATLVSINSAAVASFNVDSATQITAVLSATQATGKVRVTTPAGTGVSSQDFTVTTATATAPPTWTFDSTQRLLSLSHATLASSELEYSHDGGTTYLVYTAALTIDAAAHSASEWLGRVKAATGRPVSTATGSPAIAASTAPPTAGKPIQAAALGNSHTFGYQATGGPSLTGGNNAGSWPDLALSRLGSSALEMHNFGKSSETWGQMQSRALTVINLFRNATASDYSRRILFLQEWINSLINQGYTGVQTCQAAKDLIDYLRANGLPSDVLICLIAPYPYGDVNQAGNAAYVSDLNTKLTDAYNILLDIDKANSAAIGLYQAADFILDVRKLAQYADYNATLDRDYWPDGWHNSTMLNYLLAKGTVDVMKAPTTSKVIDLVYTPFAVNPNAACGSVIETVPEAEILYFGGSPSGNSPQRYYEGYNGGLQGAGFAAYFANCITLEAITPNFEGDFEGFVKVAGASNYVSVGQHHLGKSPSGIALDVHVGGGINLLKLCPRGSNGSYLMVGEGALKRS